MTTLRLDYQQSTPFPWAGLVLLALVTIALILTGNYYLNLSDSASSWEAKLSRLKDKGALRGSAQRNTELGAAELAQEINNANEVLRQMSVPWESFFQAIESSGGTKVTLLALDPDIEKRQVKISGEAKNYNSLTSYIVELEKQPVFASVYLQNHHVQLQDPDKPVRFILLATWRENP
jgi:Tfp pilus assembly protein PilN